MKKVLVLVSDNKYIEYTKQVIFSAKKFGRWNGDFCIITYNVDDNKIKEFTDFGVYNLNIGKKLREIFCAKYFVFDIFFKNWDLVTFLDTDMIVRGEIDLSFIKENKLYAVRECGNDPKLTRTFGMPWWQVKRDYIKVCNSEEFYINTKKEINLKYDLNLNGFNSGFLAFRSSIIEENIVNDLIKLDKKFHFLQYCGGDQGIINLYFQNNWIEAPKEYNSYIGSRREQDQHLKRHDYISCEEKEKILHFLGSIEASPWNEDNPFHEIWKINKNNFQNLNKFQDKFNYINPEKETLIEFNENYKHGIYNGQAQANSGDKFFLFSFIKTFKPKKVLEVGRFVGGSASTILEAMDLYGIDGYVDSLDYIEHDKKNWNVCGDKIFNQYEDVFKNKNISTIEFLKEYFLRIKKEHLLKKINFIDSSSRNFYENGFECKDYDLIIIDGDHSYDATLKDILTAFKNKTKLFVLVHDSTSIKDVKRAVRDAVFYNSLDIICGSHFNSSYSVLFFSNFLYFNENLKEIKKLGNGIISTKFYEKKELAKYFFNQKNSSNLKKFIEESFDNCLLKFIDSEFFESCYIKDGIDNNNRKLFCLEMCSKSNDIMEILKLGDLFFDERDFDTAFKCYLNIFEKKLIKHYGFSILKLIDSYSSYSNHKENLIKSLDIFFENKNKLESYDENLINEKINSLPFLYKKPESKNFTYNSSVNYSFIRKNSSKNICIKSFHHVIDYDLSELFIKLGLNVFTLNTTEYGGSRPIKDLFSNSKINIYKEPFRSIIYEESTRLFLNKYLSDEFCNEMDYFIFADDYKNAINTYKRFPNKKIIYYSYGQDSDDFLIKISENTKNENNFIISCYSYRQYDIVSKIKKNCFFIPISVDENIFKKSNENEKYILTINQMISRSGCNPEIFKEICNNSKYEHRLYGYQNENFEFNGKNMGILSFNDLPEIYSKASVYLYMGTEPADYTYNLLEAMMSGIPVVAYQYTKNKIKNNNIDFFIKNGYNGYFFDSVEEINKKINELMENENLRKEIGNNARKYAEINFGRKNFLKNWKECIGSEINKFKFSIFQSINKGQNK